MKTIAFDTSVLVAGLVASHPEFESAGAWLDAVEAPGVRAFWTTHAYAETWSVLTRLPLEDRIEPSDVNAVLDSLVDLTEPTPLDVQHYTEAARRSASCGGRSGAIFDALHLVAAERADVDALLTFNLSDFNRFSPTVRIASPADIDADSL